MTGFILSLLCSLMCAVETDDDCFRNTLHTRDVCAVSVMVSKHFFPIPILNRYQRYQPIPSTRCQYWSHPNMTIKIATFWTMGIMEQLAYSTKYLRIYRTDLYQIVSVGRHISGDDISDIRFVTA